MISTVFITVLCVFAVYGAIKILFCLYGCFWRFKDDKKVKSHTVLFFKNNQDEAEAYVRGMIFGRNPFYGDIIAVDMGSEDETMQILRRLEKEFDILRVMKREEYINHIKE